MSGILNPDMSDAELNADDKDQAIDQILGTTMPAHGRLEVALYEVLSASDWGFAQFIDIEDVEQRAFASDLVLSAVEGVEVNVREMALCAIDYERLVGPNGRTMPAPDATLDELMDWKRIQRTATDFARAFGSTTDCIAAVTIGVLGLPASLHGASGKDLLTMPQLSAKVPESQAAAADAARDAFARRTASPEGWLEWALELRDAVVHRGHLTQTWITRPRRTRGKQIFVSTEQPIARLIRLEPHLRAQPWHPDILTLSTPDVSAGEAIWLAEPALHTMREITGRTIALVDALCGVLFEAFTTDRTGWVLPEKQWYLERDLSKKRTQAAASFRGFDPDYPVPPPDSMHVHPRSAQRLMLAEQLRTR